MAVALLLELAGNGRKRLYVVDKCVTCRLASRDNHLASLLAIGLSPARDRISSDRLHTQITNQMSTFTSAALWTLILHIVRVSAATATACSQYGSVLREASWATQLGWDTSDDVSNWTGVTCTSTGALSM